MLQAAKVTLCSHTAIGLDPDMATGSRLWCPRSDFCRLSSVLLVFLLLHSVRGIELNSGISCELPIEIPANTYMCFETTLSRVVVGHRTEENIVQVLTQPCPSCFPEVKNVTRRFEVPIYGRVCSLKQFWRYPRGFGSSVGGVKILTTPGILQHRRYPHRTLCIWNISCPGQQQLYFNITQHHTLQDPDMQTGEHLCPDYIQVIMGNHSLESCGTEPHNMLINQVRENELQVVFRSDNSISGDGFRLDCTCFHPLGPAPQHEATGIQAEDCTRIGGTGEKGGMSSDELVPNKEEQVVIHQAFQLHFDLLRTTDACSRGVRSCARTDFQQLANNIQRTGQIISPFRNACNPIVRDMVSGALELVQNDT